MGSSVRAQGRAAFVQEIQAGMKRAGSALGGMISKIQRAVTGFEEVSGKSYEILISDHQREVLEKEGKAEVCPAQQIEGMTGTATLRLKESEIGKKTEGPLMIYPKGIRNIQRLELNFSPPLNFSAPFEDVAELVAPVFEMLCQTAQVYAVEIAITLVAAYSQQTGTVRLKLNQADRFLLC